MNKISKYNKSIHIFLGLISIIILILLTINIIFVYKSMNIEQPVEQVYFTKAEGTYDKEKKYYANTNYSNLKKLYKSEKITTVAIIDKSTNTYNKYKELINRLSFYKNTKIYLLETSKLSRKDEIAFYNLDERLKKIDGNYIITISNNKIISITTFEEEYLNIIVEGLGE